jgi:hypothetical protein
MSISGVNSGSLDPLALLRGSALSYHYLTMVCRLHGLGRVVQKSYRQNTRTSNFHSFSCHCSP